MPTNFKRGDHVEWNSEAGRVRGTIQKKVTSEIEFKGYRRHASKEEPQYIIKSDKTDHLAIHKGSALKKIKKSLTKDALRKSLERRPPPANENVSEVMRSLQIRQRLRSFLSQSDRGHL